MKEPNPDMARFMNEMPKIVVAHKPFEPGWNKVTVLSGDVLKELQTQGSQGSQGKQKGRLFLLCALCGLCV